MKRTGMAFSFNPHAFNTHSGFINAIDFSFLSLVCMCVFALLPNGSQIPGKLQPSFLRPVVFHSEPLRMNL